MTLRLAAGMVRIISNSAVHWLRSSRLVELAEVIDEPALASG
jgi:hypothetical protein